MGILRAGRAEQRIVAMPLDAMAPNYWTVCSYLGCGIHAINFRWIIGVTSRFVRGTPDQRNWELRYR